MSLLARCGFRGEDEEEEDGGMVVVVAAEMLRCVVFLSRGPGELGG